MFHKARLPQCETASAELPIKVNIDTSSQHCLCNDEGLGKGRPSILQLYPNYILVHVLLGHGLGELECQVQPVHFKSRLVPQVLTSPVLGCLDTSSQHCLCNDEGLGKGRPSILQLYPNYILVHVLLGHGLGELECQVQPVHFKSRLVPQVSTSPVLDCLDTSSWHC